MLYSEMLEQFKKWVVSDHKAQKYWAKVNSGTATYQDADNYAELIGQKWSEYLLDNFSDANYTEVIEDLRASIGKAYSESAYYSKNVQKNINKRANIGMKVLEPSVDDRLDNYIEKIATDENAEWMLDDDVISSISRSAVTDTIQANARVQSEAGLYAYVSRDGSNCCEWCNSMTGTYEYGKQPADFWKVHKDCTCTIEYKPSRTKRVEHIRYVNQNGRQRKITS